MARRRKLAAVLRGVFPTVRGNEKSAPREGKPRPNRLRGKRRSGLSKFV